MILQGGLQVGDLADPVESRAGQVDLQVLVHSQPEGQAFYALCIHMDGRSVCTIHMLGSGDRISPGDVF